MQPAVNGPGHTLIKIVMKTLSELHCKSLDHFNEESQLCLPAPPPPPDLLDIQSSKHKDRRKGSLDVRSTTSRGSDGEDKGEYMMQSVFLAAH